MNISVILAHPKKGSFNHAIALEAVKTLKGNGHAVRFHDLCHEGFDPLITPEELGKNARLDPLVAKHCRELASADGIVIVHPNWWGQPPAILKGWIDRVVRSGLAYRFSEGDSGEGIPEGLLRLKRAVVLNTSDTAARREEQVFGDPLENIWKKCVFDFCGVKKVTRKVYRIVVTSTDAQRARWLADARSTVARSFPPR